MFSGITNILFGRPSDSDDPGSSHPTNINTTQLTTLSVENNEWLIVDKSEFESTSCSESSPELTEQRPLALSTTSTPAKSESSTTSGSEEMSDFERFRGPFLSMQDLDPQSDAALSDVSSQPEHVTHPSLEECWIVTPPPCFTASESSSDTVGMHPLENLLIEHPSMSVYWPQERSQIHQDSTLHLQDHVADSKRDDPVLEAQVQPLNSGRDVDSCSHSGFSPAPVFPVPLQIRPVRQRLLRIRGSPHYEPLTERLHGRLPTNRSENLELPIQRSQVVEEQKARNWVMHRENAWKLLDQQNRVRENAASGKIRQRKDRLYCPSGRSNDRKCGGGWSSGKY